MTSQLSDFLTETAYEHCELSVNSEGFLASGEAANPCAG
jgi:PhnB protein